MESHMHGVQPEGISDEDLKKFAPLIGSEQAPDAWVEELFERLEAALDDDR